ncbi:MAG TPA: histidine kinase [Bryobacteraceae bacterium]|nr:histidine kinase [Bryobacteraceae bacterium]
MGMQTPGIPSPDFFQLLWQQLPECAWVFDHNLALRPVRSRAPLFDQPPQAFLGSSWKRKISGVLSGRFLFLRELRPAPAGGHYSLVHLPVRSADGLIRFAGGFAAELRPASGSTFEEPSLDQLTRVLHDDVGQALSVAGLQLDLLRMDLSPRIPEIAGRTEQIQALIERAMQSIRAVSYEAMDEAGRIGLPKALEKLALQAGSGLPGGLRVRCSPGVRVGRPAGTALYRIARQAVVSAAQSASCSRIEILLKSSRSRPVLEIRGREPGPREQAAWDWRDSGWLALEHRAAQANIPLVILSERGKGLLVRAHGPLAGPPG